MIINALKYLPDNIQLSGPDGSIELSYQAWQKLLAARGAVSFPFSITTRDIPNVVRLDRAQAVTITEVNAI
jgi:hypothetical protein